ncbi:MAG: hypothetical protein U0136_21925 [Bdellovibrionota bacterium]
MKRTTLFILMSSLFLLGATPSFAQPRAGDSEVEVAAGFFHQQDSDSGSLNADLSYGMYLDDRPEFGIRAAYYATYNDHAPDVWTATIAPFFDYNFTGYLDNHSVVPFVGAFVGAAFNDDDFDGTTGPEAGVKVFLNRNTYVGLRYRYEWFFTSLDVGDESSDGNHVLNVALGYDWGS